MENSFNQLYAKKTNSISTVCLELLEVINLTLNQDWLYKVSDGLPINKDDLRNILEYLSLHAYFSDTNLCKNLEKLTELKDTLKKLLVNIKTFLMPVIRERLGISFLTGNTPDKKSHEFIFSSFVAYTLPRNLEKIELLLEDLNRELLLTTQNRIKLA